jgi:hypothetical protein
VRFERAVENLDERTFRRGTLTDARTRGDWRHALRPAVLRTVHYGSDAETLPFHEPAIPKRIKGEEIYDRYFGP